MSEPKPPDRRLLAIALAIAAAATLAYACVAKTWLYNPHNKQGMEVGFGLRSMYACDAGHCESMSNAKLVAQMRSELEDIRRRAAADPSGDPQSLAFVAKATDELKTSGAFAPLGWITLICCVLGAISLLACAGLVLARKRILWPIMPTTTAILGVGIGLVTGCVFVATKPGPPGYVGVSFGFFAFGAGVVAGIGAALMLNKQLRPHDPDLLADSMNPADY